MSAGAFRLLLLIILLVGHPPVSGVFSQEASETEDSGAAMPDAHTLAERSIVFGETGASAPQPVSSPVGRVFRMILTLALVAAAIYGFVFFLKKTTRRRMRENPFLKVLASAAVGANRAVYVVSAGSQAWLVGSAESGVNLISEITDRETIDAMILENSREEFDSHEGRFPDFKSMLRRFGVPSDSESPTADNIRKRSERLKGI